MILWNELYKVSNLAVFKEEAQGQGLIFTTKIALFGSAFATNLVPENNSYEKHVISTSTSTIQALKHQTLHALMIYNMLKKRY